jgi:hypothetical protein
VAAALVTSLVVGIPALASAVTGAAPTFTADSPPVFQFGVFYGFGGGFTTAYQFAATGGPAPTFSVSAGALPTGMTLDPTSGYVSGSPTVPGQAYTYSVTASNGVLPDAVVGPFTGPVAPYGGPVGFACSTPGGLAANPGGKIVTSGSEVVTASAVDTTLPDATAPVTRVLGRVIDNGTPTVVYDQQLPVAPSDPSVQALFTAAANAATTSAPGSTIATPAVVSTVTTTSPPVQVGQVPGAIAYESQKTTETFGPATINVGPNDECVFDIESGQELIDVVTNFAQTVTDELQSTATTMTTYDVDATVSTATAPPAQTSSPPAYVVTGADGSVFGFAGATTYGSEAGQHLNAPIVAIAETPDANGYWLAAADGGVFAHGDAGYYGSEGSAHLDGPIVGIADTPDGDGYWLVAADGGVFAHGDAGYYGSAAGTHLNGEVVGIAATPDGKGYWLVAADGGVFAYGDAQFQGSAAAFRLNSPIVGIASDATTGGYWLAAADGGVFAFDAPFYGSAAGLALNEPVEAIAATSNAGGYRLAGTDGGIFDYGNASYAGSLPATDTTPPAPIVSLAN